MKVTIKDIAKDTGLSTATISKYLNSKPINVNTKKKIEESINKLNYIPNQTAQMLRSQKTKIIYLILSDLDNYFWGGIISTITDFFEEYDFTVITTSFHHNEQEEKELIKDIIYQKASGVILLPCTNQDITYLELQNAKIPVVIIDNYPEKIREYPVDFVTSNNYESGRMLAKYAIQHGHENISIMDYFSDSSPIIDRVKGIMDVYAEYKLKNPILHRITDLPTYQNIMLEKNGRFNVESSTKRQVTLIIFTNYVSAVSGLIELQSYSKNLYENYSFLVCDDEPLFLSLARPMTVVKQNLSEMGLKAAQILLKRINKDYEKYPEKIMIKSQFIERKSVHDIKKKGMTEKNLNIYLN